MRAALAVLLGCAAVAPGRDIPVYREYTQPIRFYDEQGALPVSDAAAPDRAALRAIHDSQAQGTMMGNETILEMAFGRGASMMAKPAPIPGKLTPLAAVEDETGRRKEESGQNWLAQSLSLPSLGQKPDSAAATAMATGADDSRWGWLAGEMARQPEEEGTLSEAGNPEQNPETDPEARKAVSSQKPPETAPALPLERQSYRSDSAAAEMSQTRKAMAEFTVGTRPDYAALPTTFAGAPAGAAGDAPRMSVQRWSQAAASNAGPAAVWGNRETQSGPGGDSREAASPGTRSWQGGWSAQSTAGSVLSRIEPPAPAPVAEDPITTYMNSRPPTTSGGYKPAWF
jgi:hypothetical protein